MRIARRSVFKGLAASLGLMAAGNAAAAVPEAGARKPNLAGEGFGPDPLYEKPLPIKVGEIDAHALPGVSAVEVSDYDICGYKGELKPSPPHADMNPNHAVVVAWKGKPHRVIFSHESSYDPWMELPNGVNLCNQFFEGNNGWAE